MQPPPQENPFVGVWQRQYIQIDNGPEETQQQVLWIQAERQFADVRSWPYAEPLTAETYIDLNERLQFDAALLGFAGHFSWEMLGLRHGRCSWQHRITLLPGSFDDASEFSWPAVDTLLEAGSYTDAVGILHTFEERWQRIERSSVQVQQNSEHSMIVQCGDWANVICDRRTALSNWHEYEATCWQRVNGCWQLQHGTQASLGAPLTLYPDQFCNCSEHRTNLAQLRIE